MNTSCCTWLSTLLAATLVAAGCSAPSTPTMPTQPDSELLPTAPAPMPPPSPMPPVVAAETARYRVTFEARWSPATHPVDIPGSAHFSRLVGGNHSRSVVFWREGALASQGIREMAEFGRTNPLDREISDAIASGTAESLFIGGAVDKSPGSASVEFSVSQRYPLVTLVTMVAPSPDWFVGVAGLPLFDNGQWLDEQRVELDPWDAGTDSGVTFFSPDAVTFPPALISRILTAPLSPNGHVTPLGSFTFSRLN